MFKRVLQWIVPCVLTATLFAAADPFVGDWKFSPSKSTYIDRMKFEKLDGSKYAFDFGGVAEKIAVDGTEQQGFQGTMLSVTVAGPQNWKVVRKKDGHMLLSASWELSQDGNTLTDNYTEFAPDGTPSTVKYLYKRTGAGEGFAGTWESPMPLTSSFVLQVRPYEGDGLSFIRSPQDIRNLRFDGKDYPVEGPSAPPGSTISARRVDDLVIEITEKVNGEITRTERRELSPDHKILTRTIHPVGQRDPNIFVYERQ